MNILSELLTGIIFQTVGEEDEVIAVEETHEEQPPEGCLFSV